jgi:hypothetical protein
MRQHNAQSLSFNLLKIKDDIQTSILTVFQIILFLQIRIRQGSSDSKMLRNDSTVHKVFPKLTVCYMWLLSNKGVPATANKPPVVGAPRECLWVHPMRAKARVLAKHGGPSGWLEESDLAGVIL